MRGRGGRFDRLRRALAPAEWRRTAGIATVIAGLHLIGFGMLLVLVVPGHFSLADGGVFGVGLGLTAYTLGLRHAFDADHIGAIDNTTRKLMSDGQRPLAVGFFFSLGHSTIVFLLAAAVRGRDPGAERRGRDDGSSLHQATGLIGPAVSGTFLIIIGIINLIVLVGIVRDLPADARRGVRRGRARGATRQARIHEPLLRAGDAGGHEAVADVPDRDAVRTRVRHRHRDRPARDRRRRRRGRPADLRDPLPADPLRGRDVAAGHDRRRLHELRLRMGVLPAGPQDLLQHDDHRAVRRRSRCSSGRSSCSRCSPRSSA